MAENIRAAVTLLLLTHFVRAPQSSSHILSGSSSQNLVSGPCIVSLIVEGVAELVQEVAGDCCLVVEDVVGLAQDVAGDCCFIVEGVELVQEVPGIYCLLVEGLGDLQGQPLGRVDDALDMIRRTSSLPSALIAFVCIDS